jgi:23S rRNA (cytosine1962-C5)-methyltransferase
VKTREKGRGIEDSVPEELIFGERLQEKAAVFESGLKYLVQPMETLNTGLFFDLRALRKQLGEITTNESSVLNLFSYTGSFSLVAARAGAKHVVSVDTSASCHAWAKENFALNQVDASSNRFEFKKADVFRFLEKQAKQSQVYDVIVLDPPARSRLGTGRFFLKSDLHKILAMCLAVLKPEGHLFVCDNTLQGTEKKLMKMIDKGARLAKAKCTLLKTFEPEPDFPVHPLWPKGRGVIAMQIVKNK